MPFFLLDNRSSGNFSEITTADSNSILGCTKICCSEQNCNVAMLYNNTCFLIDCVSSAACLPVRRNFSSVNLEMVLVRTVKPLETWEEIMRFNSDIKEEHHQESDNLKLDFINNIYNYDVKSKLFDALEKMSSHESENEKIPAVYGQERQFANDDITLPNFNRLDEDFNSYCGPRIGVCGENEECVRLNREQGICKCKHGYTFLKNECIPRSIIPVVPAAFTEKINKFATNSDEEPEKVSLKVTVESKNIQLPINQALLTAKVVPEDEKLNYLWSLVDKPENDKNGTITSVNNTTVRVSNLSEGLYRFKLTVSGENSYGETFVNLTVLPAARINKPPICIITPKYQNIKLPNNKAVLDGSASTDDDKIVKYKWEIEQAPLSYSPTLQESPTIELTDLKETGNYTFKLIVTDSDNVENSTTAIIEVVEEIDYPPQSNAGADVILYLPHNNVTLNGSLSTDDHGIVSWEWTKISSGKILKTFYM
jgi:dyslexia-associated protein KIAA0319-like protein